MSDEGRLRLEKSASNARRAWGQLNRFVATPALSDRDNAGIIQAFEFTFETMWKLLQKVAVQEGLPAPSPRKALAAGYALGLCVEEATWLNMLEDRNLTSHTYNAELAADIVKRIRDLYTPALGEALEKATQFVSQQDP